MITIRFDSKFQIIAQLFDSIQNEKNTIRTALLNRYANSKFQVNCLPFDGKVAEEQALNYTLQLYKTVDYN